MLMFDHINYNGLLFDVNVQLLLTLMSKLFIKSCE